VNLAAGKAVLENDLQRVLDLGYEGATLEELGWQKVGDRVLLIPLKAEKDGEQYLLRLEFLAGSDWPPSAKFVNPETQGYVMQTDQHHLPQIASPEVHVHASYERKADKQQVQLICCSAVFEYYDVEHGGDDATLWRPTDTFLITLRAIERAMRTHYLGRFPQHAG
jgi:hypothetical protein